MRWRILQSGIGTRMATTQKVIRACASLHNMSIEWEDPMPKEKNKYKVEIGHDNDNDGEWDCGGRERIRGQAKRDWICAEYF